MIIIKLHDHFPMRVADWLLAGITLSWGIACLYVSPDSWQLQIYDGLRRMGSQSLWGTCAVALGTCRMVALFINGAVRRTPHARAFGAFFTAFMWLQLSFAIFESRMLTISAGVYPWLFVGEIYNVYRAAQDARLSDKRAHEKRHPPREKRGCHKHLT